MTTEKTDPPVDPPTGGSITMKDIRSAITDIVKELIPGQTPGTDAPKSEGTPVDIKSHVDAAIAAIKRREERDAKDKSIDEQLAELHGKTAERAPVERSRKHKFMGWGD